ncbi:hypothetical protein [Gemmiger formicilis]|uniref:hypothetical protein n=1 Tax=Gemmiger formicilis TaxID=745368 RepID=UPI003520B251
MPPASSMTRLVSRLETPVVTTSSAMMQRSPGWMAEALEGHDVVDALGEDGALAHLAAQLVGVDDAAHGGADHDVDVQLLELLGNRGHDLGGLVGVLLQKCHLAVSAGVAPGGKQEVPL